MTKPMSLTGFTRRVEYIKAHRKDKKHSESAAVARKLSRQLREVLCDEQDNLNRWLERRPCIVRSPWEEGREQDGGTYHEKACADKHHDGLGYISFACIHLYIYL